MNFWAPFSQFKNWALHGVWNWNFFYMCPCTAPSVCLVWSSFSLSMYGFVSLLLGFVQYIFQRTLHWGELVYGLESKSCSGFSIFRGKVDEVVNQFAFCCCSLRLCSKLTWKGFWSKWLKRLLEIPIIEDLVWFWPPLQMLWNSSSDDLRTRLVNVFRNTLSWVCPGFSLSMHWVMLELYC